MVAWLSRAPVESLCLLLADRLADWMPKTSEQLLKKAFFSTVSEQTFVLLYVTELQWFVHWIKSIFSFLRMGVSMQSSLCWWIVFTVYIILHLIYHRVRQTRLSYMVIPFSSNKVYMQIQFFCHHFYCFIYFFFDCYVFYISRGCTLTTRLLSRDWVKFRDAWL